MDILVVEFELIITSQSQIRMPLVHPKRDVNIFVSLCYFFNIKITRNCYSWYVDWMI